MSTEPRKRRAPARRKAEPAADPDQPKGPALVLCPHCGSMVPMGDFCGHCGAHLVTASSSRRHAYAAVPAEAVVHLSLISTLFPHLAHRRGGAFRWALLLGVIAVLALATFHLFAPATAAAVFLMPVLYLLYLYEVEVYESEPWLLIGATMVAGAIFGYIFTTATGDTLSQLDLTGDSTNSFLLAAIVIPIVGQALMLGGPLFLYFFRPELKEPLDGLTFGAASALGFTLTTTLTTLWPLIIGPLVASGSPVDWALQLIGGGVLISLINAMLTSVVTGALWLQRYDLRRAGRGWEANVLTTLVVAFGAQLLLALLAATLPDLLTQTGIRIVAAAALVIYARLVIHRALLAEGAEHEIGPDMRCPECHRLVPTMLFCPSCGVARAASKPPRIRAGGARI